MKVLKQVVGLLFVLLCFAAMAGILLMQLRHSSGESNDVEGIVRSFGMYETGGSALSGRGAVIATVVLPDGRVVRAGTKPGVFLEPGAKVKVREFPQNFGQPLYGVVSVEAGAKH